MRAQQRFSEFAEVSYLVDFVSEARNYFAQITVVGRTKNHFEVFNAARRQSVEDASAIVIDYNDGYWDRVIAEKPIAIVKKR
jgi:hypothetical protein